MDKFTNIKYKLKSSTDNFEDYLKFIEVGFLSRKIVLSISPVCVLTIENGIYTLNMGTSLRKIVITFKPDEEFIEERPDGVKMKSIVTIDGNKLIQVQIEDNGRKSTHVREFTEDTLTVTTTADGWSGKVIRIYEKIQ